MKTTPPSCRRFSTTPTVATAIRPSRPGWLCAAGYRLALLTAVVLLLIKGYPLLALGSLLVVLWLCWPGERRPRGIRSQDGQWQLHLAGRWCDVELVGPLHSPPWLLAVRWRRVGNEGSECIEEQALRWLYLWPDSVAASQWRPLRKALRLQGALAGGVGRHQNGIAGLR
ncbi:protein YgfX [Parahaliea mediterranea]|uniref:protein YgfX n=1 Tax=Parahaliea mediterranea TaxID=651086 RepID=UPI0014746655|nr:protein YgfX [Parahaliea mediterranea]